MSRRRSLVLVYAVAACLVLGSMATHPASTEAAVGVKITLKCYSKPEKVTVKNTGTTTFTVQRVGSTYQPYSYEPIAVSKRLTPGSSVTFQSGWTASGPNKLTGNYIFNDNGLDGVRVKTSAGTYTKRC